MDENPVTLFYAGALDETAVARGRGDKEAGGVLEGPALGDGQDGLLGGVHVLGVRALRGAKDAGADGVERLGLGVLGDGDDDAGELDAGGPGKGCARAVRRVSRGAAHQAKSRFEKKKGREGGGKRFTHEAGVGICPGSGECRKSWPRRRAP